ncbi:MAG: hypothetical protein J5958_05060 [Clostridia bacterium]|nr:hypothetical protein [Clostridia bacterium]MBR5044181.1 hypothetical protein [Clostridia bacterium]
MILILDGDRKRGEAMQKHLWDLHLLSDVTTYASQRNRIPSDKITDRITFLLLLRPDDPSRPPLFYKTIRQKINFPIITLGGETTRRGSGAPNVPDLTLASGLTDRAILREIRAYFLSIGKPDPWDKIAGGVRDRIEYSDHTVYGTPIQFTRCERMFLRTLILAFPTPVPVEELRTRAAPPNEKKTLNALKIIASRINAKALVVVHRRIVNWDRDRFWIRTSKTDPGPTIRIDPEEQYVENSYDEYKYYPRNAF